jgi:hypothetical protein
LKAAIKGEEGEDPIPAELIYGVDETGIQEGVGCKERVYEESLKRNFSTSQGVEDERILLSL